MCGSFGSGMAGMDRCCVVSSGEVRRGKAGKEWREKFRLGMVWKGRLGVVTPGRVGQGEASCGRTG